ncbi:MAG: hypothetical protein M0R75_06020 [Dehalococcoidia bacterium]|nr:hypothetical protein [Dehalococcoidia bacterium]
MHLNPFVQSEKNDQSERGFVDLGTVSPLELIDMLRFHAAAFAASMSALSRMTAFIALDEWDSVEDSEIEKVVADIEKAVKELPHSRAIPLQIERIHNLLNMGADRKSVSLLLRELHENILAEMSGSWFLVIPDYQRHFYEQHFPLFGVEVEEAFPEALFDIAAAGRCLALGESTACVFHLMRVLEKGLHQLAREVDVPMGERIEYEQWHVVIDQITATIEKMKALPKSPEKLHRLQRYSDVAIEFRLFKEAWRDHVAHSRARYDSQEAARIWRGVRDFMRSLATARGDTAEQG